MQNITGGTVAGYGKTCFYDEPMVRKVMGNDFHIRSLRHMESVDMAVVPPIVHSEWRVIAERKPHGS